MIFSRMIEFNEQYKTREDIYNFWKNEDYTFDTVSLDVAQGRRGHIFYNYITFNMRKLETKITLDFTEIDMVEVSIAVTTAGQMITSTEAKLWPMELEMFELFMKGDSSYIKLKEDYNKKSRKFIRNVLLGIIFGSVLLSLFIISLM